MYVPHDEEDYFIQTGKLSKALAATSARADLTGIRVPHRQDDGTYKDDEGDEMTREDMADYFDRIRAVQAREEEAAAAAAPPSPPPPLPASLRPPPPAARPRLSGRKAKARGAMRRTNTLKH